jgi:hypothetical protein
VVTTSVVWQVAVPDLVVQADVVVVARRSRAAAGSCAPLFSLGLIIEALARVEKTAVRHPNALINRIGFRSRFARDNPRVHKQLC